MKANRKGKENLASPRATRSTKKKHYLSQFVREMKLGSVRKSSLGEIRANILEVGVSRDSVVTTVRPLGPPRLLGSQESLRSAETYFVELNQPTTELTILQEKLQRQEQARALKQASISRLQAQVSAVNTQVATLSIQVAVFMKEKADFTYSLSEEDKFSSVGMQMSIRAFVDHILWAVYVKAGLGEHSEPELVDWLRGEESTLFFQGGGCVSLFGVEVELDTWLFTALRSCKALSSSISRKFAHSSQLVLVATALNNLQIKEDHDIGKLFKILFHYSFTEVVKRHEGGRLTKKEATILEKQFFSRSWRL